MPVISAPHELLESDIYIDLAPLLNRELYVKCEGFNFGGSVKLRVAAAMVAAAERSGVIGPESVLVESSSGNLGIALSVIAASKGLTFTCITDIRCNRQTVRLMQALGTTVVIIDEPHSDGGFLQARLDHLRRLCAEDARYLWLNQYTNDANWIVHYETTATEIAKQFPDLDVLFAGAGTCGTVMGCARHFRDNSSGVRIVAVDAVGSVIFGGPPGTRFIPGLGSGVPPALLDRELVDDVVLVPEIDTIRTCRVLSAQGFLLGGSTGTVLFGAMSWLDQHDPDRLLKSVAVAPDLGERYLDTIYDDKWVSENFGTHALDPMVLESM